MRTFFVFLLVKIPLFVLISIFVFLFFLYLFCPIYTFAPVNSVAKSYKNWHNPYHGLDTNTQWHKANFHTHSNAWGGVTNGSNNSPKKIQKAYKKLGFSHVSVSNYQSILPPDEMDETYIPVYEHGYNAPKAHQLCLDAEKVYPFDFPLFQTAHQKQFIINKLKKGSKYVCLAHPPHWNGYSAEDLRKLDGYDFYEVLNHYRISDNFWDTVLTSQKWAYLLANDDCHDVTNLDETARCFTLVPDASDILENIANGIALGVAFPSIANETSQEKFARLKNLPILRSFKLEKDTNGSFVQVILKGAKGSAEFIGDSGRLWYQSPFSDTIVFRMPPSSTSISYLRTIIRFKDGTVFYLNPMIKVAEEGDIPIFTTSSKVSYSQTWSLRIIGLLLFGLLLLNFFAWRRKNKSKKKQRSMAQRYRW